MNKKLITTLTEILGGVSLTFGAFQIYEPLGYIVFGLLIIVISEMSA